MRVKSKICGITRLEDAEAVVRAGADAMGLVFAPQSPRRVSVAEARELAVAVAGRIIRVGLFVDAGVAAVEQVLAAVDLDLLQFHGDETAAYCRSFGVPFIKAIRVRGPLSIAAVEAEYDDACCLLLDAYVRGQRGGTGESFDWSLWPDSAAKPLVLAGGLKPGNVAQAIALTRPYGVDVSGGVEGQRKGQKDPNKVLEFVREVHGAGIE